MLAPVVVDFPLRGEWIAPNTPGKRVPSHGTDILGQRYAYYFVGINPQSKGLRFYRPSPLHYLVFGVRLQDCFGWGQPIFSSTAGNYIIIDTRDGYAVYAHAQTGSIKVSSGDTIAPGQMVANVGHSGNSTAPHLHFHLMDHQDPRKAQGIPCCFRDYEVFHEGSWHRVQHGIPKATDRIRKL